MSDDPSRRSASGDSSPDEPAETDSGESSGTLEPGGGPQRVVSEESVDDILDSLDETKSTTVSVNSSSTDESTADRDDDVTTTFDEDEVPTSDVGSSDDDPSLEELAARVEDGTVTGADVRAAEAGEGRESTPEVDELELSMDDLEATAGETDVSPPERGSSTDGTDDGPLAGSVRDDTTDSCDDDGDEPAGLLDRLVRLFGG